MAQFVIKDKLLIIDYKQKEREFLPKIIKSWSPESIDKEIENNTFVNINIIIKLLIKKIRYTKICYDIVHA